jgi:hypothetical protein
VAAGPAAIGGRGADACAVYAQALATYAQEFLFHQEQFKAAVLDATMGEVDTLVLQRRSAKLVQPLRL